MTGTFDGSDAVRATSPAGPRSTWGERAIVLGGFAVAALSTAASLVSGAGAEAIGPLWLAATAWAVVFSLALALRRGIRRRDWSAFRRYRLSGNGDVVDWTRQGQAPTPTCAWPRNTNA